MKLKLWLATFGLMGLLSPAISQARPTDPLRALPVQDSGRIKPFDTFANEALEMVYGKSKYEGKPADEIVMTWLLQPQVWQDKPIFEVKHFLLKRALNIPVETKYVSVDELMKNDRLPMVIQELNAKREAKEKLDPYGQAIQRLETQLFTFREIAAGRLIKVWPGGETDSWKSLVELPEGPQAEFLNVTKAFISCLDSSAGAAQQADLQKAMDAFTSSARAAAAPGVYPTETAIDVEIHYNSFRPFMWAWIFYVLAVISLILTWVLTKPVLAKFGWAFTILGFLFHFYGFALRVYLTGRPPVSNMYETVLWVSFGTVLFAMIIEAIYRWRVILLAGASVGAFCLILSDLAPAVLDPSIQPLEPVLRSNFWLTVHVMTITISYAAFFLAFALGDLGLFFYLKDEKKYADRLRAIVLSLYRAIQIGVCLLAPGIILGGIWADYSWGRFWGWDPKETWALIALLGYIAVLHARLAGLIKNFGMVCTGVISFSLVVMAWYGVNFVLGAGLHTYGFGAGGVEYVSAFVAAHILFVVFVTMVRRGRMAAAKKTAN